MSSALSWEVVRSGSRGSAAALARCAETVGSLSQCSFLGSSPGQSPGKLVSAAMMIHAKDIAKVASVVPTVVAEVMSTAAEVASQ